MRTALPILAGMFVFVAIGFALACGGNTRFCDYYEISNFEGGRGFFGISSLIVHSFAGVLTGGSFGFLLAPRFNRAKID